MDKKEIKVYVDLKGVNQQLQNRIRQTTDMVGVGLHHTRDIQSIPKGLPNALFSLEFEGSNQATPGEIRARWVQWILSSGFRDLSEAVHEVLEWVQSILSQWKLQVRQSGGDIITGADWNSIVVERAKRFHGLGFPAKLQFLENEYKFVPEPELTGCATSINAVRNCLVHRGGWVTERDAPDRGELVLKWRGITLYGTSTDGKRELDKGDKIKDGEGLSGITKNRTKTFKVGSNIKIGANDFSEVAWTIMAFGRALTRQLSEWGRLQGIMFDSKPPTGKIETGKNAT